MKIKAANGFARILKAEGIPWVSCYPTNHVNNALGEEGVPILMMGEERFAVAVADALLARHQRQADRRVHRHGQPERRRHPDGLRRHRPGLGGLLAAARDRRGRGRRARSRHTHYDMAEALQVGHQVGGQGRPRRPRAGLRAPRVHPSPVGPARARAAHHPARSRRVRRGRAPVLAGEGLAVRPRSRRRAVRRQGAAGRQGPAALRGRGRALRRRHRRAAAVRRARPGPGAHHAEGQGRLPGEPPAVGGRARLARRALPPQGRPPLLDRLQPLPQPVQPRHPRRRAEDHRPVHGGPPGHQPELRDPPRRDRRREADAAGAPRRALGAGRAGRARSRS